MPGITLDSRRHDTAWCACGNSPHWRHEIATPQTPVPDPSEQAYGLRRTGVTGMTFAQLAILDVAVLIGSPRVRLVRGSTYSEFVNVNYTHGLSDAELEDTIKEMQSLGWVWLSMRHVRRSSLMPTGLMRRVHCTDAGLEAWESERRPDWSTRVCYCIRSLEVSSSPRPDINRMGGMNRDLCVAAIQWLDDVGMIKPTGRVRWFFRDRAQLEGAKELPGVHVAIYAGTRPLIRPPRSLQPPIVGWWDHLPNLAAHQQIDGPVADGG